MSIEDNAGIQQENSEHHLKPWQFKKGQSGNPSGRPKGTVSLKTWAKKYIQELTDEEKLDFLEGIDKKTVWEMSEGKPEGKSEINATVEHKLTPEVKQAIEGALEELI
jgi:hypothetical protein